MRRWKVVEDVDPFTEGGVQETEMKIINRQLSLLPNPLVKIDDIEKVCQHPEAVSRSDVKEIYLKTGIHTSIEALASLRERIVKEKRLFTLLRARGLEEVRSRLDRTSEAVEVPLGWHSSSLLQQPQPRVQRLPDRMEPVEDEPELDIPTAMLQEPSAPPGTIPAMLQNVSTAGASHSALNRRSQQPRIRSQRGSGVEGASAVSVEARRRRKSELQRARRAARAAENPQHRHTEYASAWKRARTSTPES